MDDWKKVAVQLDKEHSKGRLRHHAVALAYSALLSERTATVIAGRFALTLVRICPLLLLGVTEGHINILCQFNTTRRELTRRY